MTLPASISSPPILLTPRRWPAESRPLRDEPPAFLCAMCLSSACVDRGDLQFGEGLAMAALPVRVLAALLFEGDDLLAAALFDDLRFDRCARNQRATELGVLAAEQHNLAEGELRADVARQLLDRQHIVLGDRVLFSARADDRKHVRIPWKFAGNQRKTPTPRPRKPGNILTRNPGSRSRPRVAGLPERSLTIGVPLAR